MSEFEFLEPKQNDDLKAAIHLTGKLGFTFKAIQELDLLGKYLKIAKKKNDQDNNLYLFIEEEPDKKSFKVIKAGKYVYVNMANLFDDLQYDYKTKYITFNLIREEKDGMIYYKLIKKEKPRNSQK